MKEYTKFLRKESETDKKTMRSHNNSKEAKRTDVQNAQSRADRYNYYLKKWTEFYVKSNTKAQKIYCNDVLSRLDLIK